jgi:hypothetical protein
MRKSFKSARSPDSSDGAFGESERRELARRSSAGVDVTLYWHPALDELIVRICDERHGAYFRSALSATWPLDVYYHPYAYADLEDVVEKENSLAA